MIPQEFRVTSWALLTAMIFLPLQRSDATIHSRFLYSYRDVCVNSSPQTPQPHGLRAIGRSSASQHLLGIPFGTDVVPSTHAS